MQKGGNRSRSLDNALESPCCNRGHTSETFRQTACTQTTEAEEMKVMKMRAVKMVIIMMPMVMMIARMVREKADKQQEVHHSMFWRL